MTDDDKKTLREVNHTVAAILLFVLLLLFRDCVGCQPIVHF